MAGEVTSTLHQKLKFFVEGRLVIIGGEEDIFISYIESYRHTSAYEDWIATLFQVLEVASTITLPVEKVKNPTMTSWRDLQIVVENGDLKGWGKLPEISEKKNHFGLGYESSKATLKGKARFPPIRETFISKGVEHGEQVAMMSHKDNIKKASYYIRECAPGEELKNWTIVEIPEILFPK